MVVGKKTFQDVLTSIRDELGMSNVKFAEYIGFSKTTTEFWLNGQRSPNISNLVFLSDRLNLSTDYLLGITEVKTKNESVRISVQTTGLSEESVNNIATLNQDDKKIINEMFENHFLQLLIPDMRIYKSLFNQWLLYDDGDKSLRNMSLDKSGNLEITPLESARMSRLIVENDFQHYLTELEFRWGCNTYDITRGILESE